MNLDAPESWTIHLLGREVRVDRVSVACVMGGPWDCPGTAGEPPVPCECPCHERVICSACTPPEEMSAWELVSHSRTHTEEEILAWKAGEEDLVRTIGLLRLVEAHPPIEQAEWNELYQRRRTLGRRRLEEGDGGEA